MFSKEPESTQISRRDDSYSPYAANEGLISSGSDEGDDVGNM